MAWPNPASYFFNFQIVFIIFENNINIGNQLFVIFFEIFSFAISYSLICSIFGKTSGFSFIVSSNMTFTSVLSFLSFLFTGGSKDYYSSIILFKRLLFPDTLLS